MINPAGHWFPLFEGTSSGNVRQRFDEFVTSPGMPVPHQRPHEFLEFGHNYVNVGGFTGAECDQDRAVSAAWAQGPFFVRPAVDLPEPHRAPPGGWVRPAMEPGRVVKALSHEAWVAPYPALAIPARTFDDHGVFRDAQPIPKLPLGAQRVEARRSRIWIRIDGRWLLGHIQCWHRLADGSWTVWLSYQADPEHPTVAPVWGRYAYNAATILNAVEWPRPPKDP